MAGWNSWTESSLCLRLHASGLGYRCDGPILSVKGKINVKGLIINSTLFFSKS